MLGGMLQVSLFRLARRSYFGQIARLAEWRLAAEMETQEPKKTQREKLRSK